MDIARPLFVIYVLWHPNYAEGAVLAEILRKHFRRELYASVTGGTGLSVIFRSECAPGTSRPIPIDLAGAETTAVVVLAESSMAEDQDWVAYLRELAKQANVGGFGARLFPVAIDRKGLLLEEQAIRWDQWAKAQPPQDLCLPLISELTYSFCRTLRHHLEHLRRPDEEQSALCRYLQKVQIFLSHSKHDDHGEHIAHEIRDHLYRGRGLGSFFDVHDIPAGVRFDEVLLEQVAHSAVVAIHTDSYSSREWCRREIIEAKRRNVPLVVANCLGHLDERGFPYMGNVPIVRMDPDRTDKIDIIIGRLLDEVLKDFLWRCRVELAKNADDVTIFVPRVPELISLAALPSPTEANPTIVYPDPPLSAEEQRLFETIAPRVRLRCVTEWLAGVVQ